MDELKANAFQGDRSLHKMAVQQNAVFKLQHLARVLTLWSTDGEDTVVLLCCCLENKIKGS